MHLKHLMRVCLSASVCDNKNEGNHINLRKYKFVANIFVTQIPGVPPGNLEKKAHTCDTDLNSFFFFFFLCVHCIRACVYTVRSPMCMGCSILKAR